MDSSIKEAQAHMAAAEKALATSFFKRKPDNETATLEYESAAKAFQYAKQYQLAANAFICASDTHAADGTYYFAAKHLESAANIYLKDLNQPAKAAELFVKACNLFRRNNNGDRAIEQLEKAGKAMEPVSVAEAIKYFKEACDLYEAEDKLRLGLDTFKRVIGLCLKDGKLQEAIDFSRRSNEVLVKVKGKHLTMRGFLSTIIIVLAYGDEVEAGKQYEQFCQMDSGWMTSDEGRLADALLTGYSNRDDEQVSSTIKKQLIGFLDVEVVKLARKLRAPGATKSLEEAKITRPNPEVSTSLVDDIEPPKPPITTEESSDLC